MKKIDILKLIDKLDIVVMGIISAASVVSLVIIVFAILNP